jgi:Tfp pilus assembly protein PilF
MHRKILSSAVLMAALLGGCTQKSPEQTLAGIQQDLQNDNFRSAEIKGKSLLTEARENKRPELVRAARLLLARTYFQFGDNINAARFYDALERLPGTDGAPGQQIVPMDKDWHQWVMAALENRDPELVDEILKSEQAPFNDKAREIYKILQLRAEGASADAMSVLELTEPPSANESPFIRYQYTRLTAHSDLETAMTVIEEITAADPHFSDALLFKARLHQARGEGAAALENYILYSKQRPGDADASVYTALAAFQQKDYETGKIYVQKLARQAANHPMTQQLQAMQFFFDKRFDDAMELAQRSLNQGLESFINHLIIGVGAYQQHSWEQANRHLTIISDRLPSDHFGRKMLVETKLQLNESEEAAEIFQNLDTRDAIDVALANRVSHQLISRGIFDDASMIQQKVADIDVEQHNLANQRYILNQALKRNEFKQALVESVKSEDAGAKDKLRLVFIHLADGETDKADRIVTQWLSSTADDLHALNAAAMVAQRKGDKRKMMEYIDRALSIDPDNIPSLLLQLSAMAAVGDAPATRRISSRLMDDLSFINPMVYHHWLGSSYHFNQLDWEKAQASLQGDNREALEGVLLNFLLRTRQLERVETYLAERGDEKQWSKSQRVASILADIEHQQPGQASAHLQNLIDSPVFDDASMAQFTLGIAARIEQYDMVFRILQKADGKGITVRNRSLIASTAYLKQGEIKEARTSLLNHPTQDTAYHELDAEILMAERKYRDAWEALEKAIEPRSRYSVLVKMYEVGRKINASKKVRAHIRDYFNANPKDSISRRRIAQWYMENNPQFAIELLDVSMMQKELQKDWITTNNLAWLYHQVGDTEKAQQYAKHAISHAPERAEVIDTYETVFGKKP